MITAHFTLDADSAIDMLYASADAVRRGSVRGINDAAFALRKRTPDIVDEAVEGGAVPFTKSPKAVAVQRATSSEAGAVVEIGGPQGAYLSISEYGGDGLENRITGVGKARDARGNVVKRLYRSAANIEKLKAARVSVGGGKTVGKFFVGVPRGGKLAGIYERVGRNNRISLVAAFIKRARYQGNARITDGWSGVLDETGAATLLDAIEYEMRKEKEASDA